MQAGWGTGKGNFESTKAHEQTQSRKQIPCLRQAGSSRLLVGMTTSRGFFDKLFERGAAKAPEGIAQRILEMAGCGAVLFQIFLVIFFRTIKRACRGDFGGDGALEFAAGGQCRF